MKDPPGPVNHFHPPLVVPPKTPPHTLSIIFLHGRGHIAKHTCQRLLSMPVTGHSGTLPDALPHARLVFPEAPLSRATKYRKARVRQWYDGSGDWEMDALGGMGPSVEHVHQLVHEEARLVGGDAARVVLAGFSQGCAMALTSLLLWDGPSIGAVVGMSGFIPLNAHMRSLLAEESPDGPDPTDGIVFGYDSQSEDERSCPQDSSSSETCCPRRRAVEALREEAELPPPASPARLSFLETPVFLGHGTQDREVELRHGQLSASLLGAMGVAVELRSYAGLDHSYSPDMLGDAISFLTSHVT